jgi:hypothetical protein
LLEKDRAVATALRAVIRSLQEDMKRVQVRLQNEDVGPDTQALQGEIRDTLEELVRALRPR